MSDAIEQAFNKIHKEYGGGAIRRLGDEVIEPVEPLPTGHVDIDEAMGIGGFPRGRIVELYGPESSGKTTLAMHACAEAQRLGLEAAFIDVEHAFDPLYAANLGIDVDKLVFAQPSSAEEALEIVDTLVDSGAFALIIIDSVAALTPRAELLGDMGDTHMGLQARLMGQAMRKLTAKAEKAGTCLIFINQIREKIGVMFGSPETTPGGRALKFYASMRVDVRRKDQIKADGQAEGNVTKIKIVKNKVAAPFREAEVEIYYGQGIDMIRPMLERAAEAGVLVKKGANWYTWDAERFGTSGATARQHCIDHPEFYDELRERMAAYL